MGLVLKPDEILKAEDLKTERVEVPEWGGDVIVRELKGKARDEFEASQYVKKGDKLEFTNENARAKLVVRSLVDEDGKLLFTPNQASFLGDKSGAVLDRLYDVAAKLSGLTPNAVEDAKGNSEAVPSDGSTSE